MPELPPPPTMTRLHQESRDVFLRLFEDGAPNASLEDGRKHVAEKYGCASWDELREAATQSQGGLPGEPEPAHLRVLVDAGAKEHSHSGARLYDHLVGTRDLLAEWGNPHHLSVAGLFHSIYGTERYKITSIPLERRRELAEHIGDHAEQLAYIFCVSHRADFFRQLGRERPTLKDVVHSTDLTVTPDILIELIELEVANCVEQIYPQRANSSTVAGLTGMLDAPLSDGARASLEELIQRCEAALAHREEAGGTTGPATLTSSVSPPIVIP